MIIFNKKILKLISEFSKPLTNPNWKKMHLLTNYQLYRELYKYEIECHCADWFSQWKLIARFGIVSYCSVYKYEPIELLKRVDIQYANSLHKQYINMDKLEYKIIYEYL